MHNTALCVPPPDALLDRFAAEGALPAPRKQFGAIVDRRDAAAPRAADPARGREPRATGSSRTARRGSASRCSAPLHNRERCDGCGYCILGCAYNRKRHAVFAFLEDAVRAGLRIVTRAKVDSLRREGGRLDRARPGVLGARAPRRARGRRAAHAGAPAPEPDSDRAHDRPLAAAPPVRAGRGDLRRSRRRAPRSSPVRARRRRRCVPRRTPRRVPLHGVGAPGPATTAAFVPGPAGPGRRRACARYRHLAPAGVLLHDELPSRVTRTASGRPRIHAWPRGDDEASLRRGIAQLARALVRGRRARRDLALHAHPDARSREADLAKLAAARFRPYDVMLTSVHPHASVPMGRVRRRPRPSRRIAPRRARPLRRGRLRDPVVDRRPAAGDDHGVRDRDRGGRGRRGPPVTRRLRRRVRHRRSAAERAPRAPRARACRDRAAARPGRRFRRRSRPCRTSRASSGSPICSSSGTTRPRRSTAGRRCGASSSSSGAQSARGRSSRADDRLGREATTRSRPRSFRARSG